MPSNMKAFTLIFGTNTVRRYKITTFVSAEKSPNVRMLRGRLIRLTTGFIIKSIIVRTNPPIRSVGNPPTILTPDTIKGRIKSANA